MRRAMLLAALLPALAFAADKPTPKTRPQLPGVDWQAMTIRATGRGAPRLDAPSIAAARIGAEKAAELDALRNILATLKSVQLSSERTVGEAMAGSDTVRAKVEGEAKGFKRLDTRYFSDGGVEIDVVMSLEGVLADVLPEAPAAEAVAKKLPANGEATNTGLIVDARGLKPKPALSPRLLDESGKEVYDAGFITMAALKANGIVGYLKDFEAAKKSARVGERPLVVKALKVAGASDLVLAKADAEKLRDPKGNVSYLGEGRVIIVSE